MASGPKQLHVRTTLHGPEIRLPDSQPWVTTCPAHWPDLLIGRSD